MVSRGQRRCSAKTATGKRCKRPSYDGGVRGERPTTQCSIHNNSWQVERGAEAHNRYYADTKLVAADRARISQRRRILKAKKATKKGFGYTISYRGVWDRMNRIDMVCSTKAQAEKEKAKWKKNNPTTRFNIVKATKTHKEKYAYTKLMNKRYGFEERHN